MIIILKKWGLGICLLIWFLLAFAAILTPIEITESLIKSYNLPQWYIYVIYGLEVFYAPMVAYYMGIAFGFQYDKIPMSKGMIIFGKNKNNSN